MEVCDKLEKMVAYLEPLQTEGLPIGETCRLKLLCPILAEPQDNLPYLYHWLRPQANGTAERSVGLVKSLAARALASANLDKVYWSYAVRYAAQSLMSHALQKTQRSLPFEWQASLLGSPRRPDLAHIAPLWRRSR